MEFDHIKKMKRTIDGLSVLVELEKMQSITLLESVMEGDYT